MNGTSPDAHIPGVLRALFQQGIPYRLIQAQSPEDKALTEWTEAAYPWGFSQIDWTKSNPHKCSAWRSLDDLVPAFQAIVSALESSDSVVVMWANAQCPSLEMRLGDVAKVAKDIFEEHETSTDVLVFSRSGEWLIEMNHEGTLCRGRSGASLNAAPFP